MRLSLWILVVLVNALGCDGDEKATTVADLDCDGLQTQWHGFVETHQSCVNDDDCALVNQYVGASTIGWSCDQQHGLLAGIRSDALAQAQPFVERYFGCFEAEAFTDPWSDHGWDAAPPNPAQCDGNRCTVTSDSCFVFGGDDAGD